MNSHYDPFIDFADPNLVLYPSKSLLWAELRKQAFEKDVTVKDPWSDEFYNDESPTQEFRIQPIELLKLAKEKAPEKIAFTASAFSDWVYSLYRKQPNLLGMAKGRAAEELWDKPPPYNPTFSIINSSSWKLTYCGIGKEGDAAKTLSAPSLQILGTPMKCKPDLVYLNNWDSCAVIIEVKCTTQPLPRSLWPNIWAQLWSYSKIQQFAALEHLLVVAEIWAIYGKSLVLRRMVRRNPRREVFDRFYTQLFDIYQEHLSKNSHSQL